MYLNFLTAKTARTILLIALVFCFLNSFAQSPRTRADFDQDWRFNLGDVQGGESQHLNDGSWRQLNLPHDWSIEGQFSKDNPATPEGGALPGGIGWYRKTFSVPASSQGKQVYIDFDGVYQKSTVWINGHQLGFRPNGYISFEYDLTPYLNFGGKNTIAVKVDNSVQPNSRWYSGSGIYRNVWLVTTNKIAIDHWGTYISTPEVNESSAKINLEVAIKVANSTSSVIAKTIIYNEAGKAVSTANAEIALKENHTDNQIKAAFSFNIKNPKLWSVDRPYLYKAVTSLISAGKLVDQYTTPFGIRYFNFDADKGFSLNGKPLKILGVCDHHDLGSLGAAVNYRALERQLQMLKEMGCNGIRTSHNPPTPELLELADKLGFIVMDEAFDSWEWGKVKYDYHLFFKEWHKRDLEDQILRDRNHPSVFIWSVGNEIPQQGDTSALRIAPELAAIVHSLDKTRPITTANDRPDTSNKIIKSGAIDLVGYNYHEFNYAGFHDRYPGRKFIATETTSGLETRGFYQMPSDSIMRWPTGRDYRTPAKMNADNTVSAYDNVSPPWGSTHEETWKVMKKYDFLSGMFIWTGWDYLGEPTPYSWPSRSSYFGIIDLAGFPKDVFYMYQSEWTNKTVLHLLPHWNWQPGQPVDVWAYYNHAGEVELFLNGKSLGIKKKQGEDLHVMWRVKFEPGTIKVVSRKDGKIVRTDERHTAGVPAKIVLTVDRKNIKADVKDLAFVSVKVLDKNGVIVPDANNLIHFELNGAGSIATTDNGSETDHDLFQTHDRHAFNGLALAILRSNGKAGVIKLVATAAGLTGASIFINAK